MTNIHKKPEEFQISGKEFEPAYVKLYNSGELENRAQQAVEWLQNCTACPRNCEVDRAQNQRGVCKIGRYAMVDSYFAHPGEEDCLRGWQGSGTIFFSSCNLSCVFCQNMEISHSRSGAEVTAEELSQIMIELQRRGCHNVNFVTPEHVVPQVIEAMPDAVKMGLKLPIVYNTSGYDSLESLKLLDGIVDIYMPDFKFWDHDAAAMYLKAGDYPDAARAAIKEMHRQVGDLVLDENGLARRGLLIRYLVMPDDVCNTQEIMKFLVQEISPHTFVNIMAQYHPAGKVCAEKYAEINRRITAEEYNQACRVAGEVGLYRFDSRKIRMIRLL